MSWFFQYPDDAGEDSARDKDEFLAGLGRDDWATLLDHMETRRFRTGEVLVQEGEIGRSLYLITEGTVEIGVTSKRGMRRVRSQGAGSILGEISFLDGQPRSATVMATSDGEVLRLGEDGFERLSARHPDLSRTLLFDLGRVLATRLRRVEALLAT